METDQVTASRNLEAKISSAEAVGFQAKERTKTAEFCASFTKELLAAGSAAARIAHHALRHQIGSPSGAGYFNGRRMELRSSTAGRPWDWGSNPRTDFGEESCWRVVVRHHPREVTFANKVQIVYLDESKQQQAGVLTVAGYAFIPERAALFEVRWLAVLRNAEIRRFHMSEFETRRGEFSAGTNEYRREVLAALFEVIRSTASFEVSASLDLSAFEELTAGERILQRFKSAEHAQRFLVPFSAVSNHFRPRRHRLTASSYRQFRTQAHIACLDVTRAGACQ